MAAPAKPNLDDILSSRTYEKLEARRYGRECCLIVQVDGIPWVYFNNPGKRLAFRHAWQFKEWLSQRFDIQIEHLPVENCQNRRRS